DLEPELFEASDQELAAEALGSAPGAFTGITLDRLRKEGPIRLDLPPSFAPFADGGFGTPSGKCEFYSAQMAARGLDPLPTYVGPHEAPLTRPDLAARYPLQMVSPPEPSFLNSTFVNLPALREQAGEPTVHIHADDAGSRGIADGAAV